MIDLIINGKKFEEIELVIFDKDGTLFELYPYWAVVAQNRADNICRAMHIDDERLVDQIAFSMGVDNTKKVMRPDSMIGVRNRSYIQNALFEELQKQKYPINKQMIIDAFQETDTYISQDEVLRKSLVPVKGILDFLPAIHDRCKCAIFSYDRTSNLEHITKIMNIDPYFSILLGGDMINYPKPDPWGVIKIMQDLNISPENTMLIGDSIHDIQSGRTAGCKYTVTRKSEISDLISIELLTDIIIDDYMGIRNAV